MGHNCFSMASDHRGREAPLSGLQRPCWLVGGLQAAWVPALYPESGVFDRKRLVARGARPKYSLADLASTRLTTRHDSDKLAPILIKRVGARG
jgi:hypothetical protein